VAELKKARAAQPRLKQWRRSVSVRFAVPPLHSSFTHCTHPRPAAATTTQHVRLVTHSHDRHTFHARFDAAIRYLNKWLDQEEDTADLVLAMGTSLCGMSADRIVEGAARRRLEDSTGLGAVIVGFQRTRMESLRIFAAIDEVMASDGRLLRSLFVRSFDCFLFVCLSDLFCPRILFSLACDAILVAR